MPRIGCSIFEQLPCGISQMSSSPFFRNVSLSDAVLRVRSLAETLRFYRDCLGLRAITANAQRAELSASGEPPALIVLEEHAEAPERLMGTPRLFHLALLFPDRTSLATATWRLGERNYPMQGASDHGVSEAIYLADPEGNGLELYTDRPSEVWPRSGDFVNMSTRPLALRILLSLAEKTRDDYAIPPESRLGHVHLNVSDLGRAEVLMAGQLAMQVRQRNFPNALFFGYNGYHHHIATNTWNVHRPAKQGSLGLASLTLRLTPELRERISAPETSALDGIAVRVQTYLPESTA